MNDKFEDTRFGSVGVLESGLSIDGKTGRMHDLQFPEYWAFIGSYSGMLKDFNDVWSVRPRHAIEYCLKSTDQKTE